MIYHFNGTSLDTDRLELVRDGALVTVEPQVFSLIVQLIEKNDRVVSKDELIEIVWGGRIVSDTTLNSRINAARRALGDTGKDQAVIRTFARRGFRFVANLQVDSEKAPLSNSGASLLASDGLAIAVLPFSNLSNDREHEYLADGIVEDIITELSKHRWLQVIARNTTSSLQSQSLEIPEIGQRLGVQYVMDGSIRSAGERIRVNAQLSNVETGMHVWAQKYDRDLVDIFAVQDDIASSVAGVMQPELMSAEFGRIRRKEPSNMDAWEHAVRGRLHLLRVTKEDNSLALELLREGLAKYPESVTLTAFLSFGLNSALLFGWSKDPPGYISEAYGLAVRAVALDAADAWAQCAMGFACFISKRHEEAISHYRKATELNPSFALGHGYLALQLAFAGQPDDAIAEAEQAIRLSPHDPELFHFQVAIATAHFVAGRYSEASEWAEISHFERPSAPGPLRLLAAALALQGKTKKAREAFAKVLKITPLVTEAGLRAVIHFGRPADLEKYIESQRIAGLPG